MHPLEGEQEGLLRRPTTAFGIQTVEAPDGKDDWKIRFSLYTSHMLSTAGGRGWEVSSLQLCTICVDAVHALA
jgi:hypothetical protein